MSSPPGAPARGAAHHHTVRFYESDAFLLSEIAGFVAEGLAAGESAVVIATSEHRAGVAGRLAAEGVAVEEAISGGRLRLLDARTVLSALMAGDAPDPSAFRAVVERILDDAAEASPAGAVRAYGEMVDLLCADGNGNGALKLEELWDDLASTRSFALLCAYAMERFADAAYTPLFRSLCRVHGRVRPAESLSGADPGERAVEISVLQQRARALETELARRAEVESELRASLAERERAEARVRRSERQLRDLLESAAEGIHWVGPDGVIRWANQAELEMLGYTADEYVGRNIADFHADRDVIDDMLARLTRGETLHEYQARLRRKDGSIRHVLVNSNVWWEDGRFIHTRCFTRDITQFLEAAAERERLLERERAARAEAEEARLAAEEANRAKSDFLAVMSHELRTPLNAIAGYAELLEIGVHGPLGDEQREAVRRIQRSQHHLLGLIDDILLHARIEAGRVRYEVGPVAMDDLLRTAASLVLPELQARGLRYEYAGCDPSLEARADAERVRQIVVNLLANAVKFTPPKGTITVECEAVESRVRVRVRDTGVGIPADRVASIFEPFVQVDAGLTRVQQGVGLGLAISRDLAHGMGGDLQVDSTPGGGSTFTLTLPR